MNWLRLFCFQSSRGSAPCTLKNLSEGVIGHIEVLASGRVRLNLGNDRIMYIDAGTPTPTREVSKASSLSVVHREDPGSTGDLNDVLI